MNIEEQSDINLINHHRDALLYLHESKCSYGKAFPDKSARKLLKKYDIVVRPENTAKWYAELSPFTRGVLGVE